MYADGNQHDVELYIHVAITTQGLRIEREKHYISSSHLGLIRCPTPLGVSAIKYAHSICDILGGRDNTLFESKIQQSCQLRSRKVLWAGLPAFVLLPGTPQGSAGMPSEPACPHAVELLQTTLEFTQGKGVFHGRPNANRMLGVCFLRQVSASGAATICETLNIRIPLLHLLQCLRLLAVLATQNLLKRHRMHVFLITQCFQACQLIRALLASDCGMLLCF